MDQPNPWSEVPDLTLVSCNWRAEFERDNLWRFFNTPHGILKNTVSAPHSQMWRLHKTTGFFLKNHVWWGTILISWIQETMLVWSNWTYITFLNIRPFSTRTLLAPFFPRRRTGCFGYTLRVSEASTARVSSRGGADAGCSLLGLEAQVTERKPKITRSAATSVPHVLKSDVTKATLPKFSMDRRNLLWFK